MFVFYTFYNYRHLLEPPGDLILILTVNSTIRIIMYFINAIYYNLNDKPIQNDSIFCQFTGLVFIINFFAEIYYNFVFSFFILLRIKYLLKDSDSYKQIYYHLLFVILSFFILFFLITHDSIGKSHTGRCGIKACSKPFMYFFNIFVFINLFIILFTLRYFIHKLPSYSKIKKIKAEIINYLCFYMISYILYALFYQILYFFIEKNSSIWHNNSFYYVKMLLVLEIIISPTILFIMRYNHLFLKEIFRKLFCLDRCFSIFSLKKDQLIEPHPKYQINESELIENSSSQMEKSIQKSDKLISKINLKPPKFSFEVDITHKKSSDKGEVGFFSINIISFNMKVLYTRSILSGILQSINEKCTIAEESDSYKEIKSFWIKDHDKSLFELKITAYAPRIFKKLILIDTNIEKICSSLDITKNDTNIKKSSSVSGGKSGEFFLSTYDNKLIIKTISMNDLLTFLRILAKYNEYLLNNEESLIAKIYGLYSIYRKDVEVTNNVIIMRNIINSNKKNVQVCYDLKGSSYDRDVLKKYIDKQTAYKEKKTLKDQDFLKLEEFILIDKNIKDKLIFNITKDANFFRSVGIMDYSLFLVKLKQKFRASNTQKQLFSVKSEVDDGTWYNMGIIDYLQEYTTKKKIEKFIKKVINVNYKLDTSSQDENTYAERFVNFFQKIII